MNTKNNEHYLRVFQEALDDARYKSIVERQLAKAEGGDTRAARMIIEHAQGKPAQRIEVVSRQDDALSQIQLLLAQAGQPVQYLIESRAEPSVSTIEVMVESNVEEQGEATEDG